VRESVARALAEDIGALGDLTASLIPVHHRATGAIVAREEGVLAGCAAATEVFHQVDPALEVRWLADDGHEVSPGLTVAHVEGPLTSMLTAERTALNILCHLSGVATLTRKWVDAVVGTSATIRDTRKTTPLMRRLERYAVRCGGGANHRMSLSDSALVKDNHALAAGGVGLAYKRVRAASPDVLVQVEVGSVEEALEALEAGAGVLLLDNMPASEMRRAVRRIGGRAQVEASGSLSLERAWAVAQTGVDGIAVSALAQSAPALDIALDLRQREGVY
jgi:nicotinate-nucleotide pyrophosphorylase (carboxylating)